MSFVDISHSPEDSEKSTPDMVEKNNESTQSTLERTDKSSSQENVVNDSIKLENNGLLDAAQFSTSTLDFTSSIPHNPPFISPKSSGITQSIRNRLNFNDEIQWKKFSARRLELIDTLSLSTKKASEQDDEICKVSETLRLEYGFGSETHADFDKLVRAAIQSVRRNRKRQPKTKHSSLSSHSSPVLKNARGEITWKANANVFQGTDSQNDSSSDHDTLPYPSKRKRPLSKTASTTLASNNYADGREYPDIHSSEGDSVQDLKVRDSSMLPQSNENLINADRISIYSLISPSTSQDHMSDCGFRGLPLPSIQSNDAPHSSTPLPSMAQLNLGSSVEDSRLNLAMDKLATYADICKQSQPLKLSENREALGDSLLSCSAATVVEKRTINEDSETAGSEIRQVLLSDPVVQSLACSLSLSAFVSTKTASRQLKCLIADCSREFGLEAVITSLITIFEELLSGCVGSIEPDIMRITVRLRSYSGLSLNSRRIPSVLSSTSSTISSSGTSLSSASISSASVKPVTLRFLNKKLDFTFAASTSTPPTLSEVLENGRTAFQIVDDNKVLGVRSANNSSKIFETDLDVEEAFKDSRVDLEIYFPTVHKLVGIDKFRAHIEPNNPRFQELL